MSEHPPSEDTPHVLPAGGKNQEKTSTRTLVIAILIVVAVLAGIAAAVYGLMQNAGTTAQIRDVFLIFLAVESLIIGVALVVLIIQLAGLINLLQNEVRPILDATNETVNTLRGTTEFLSENLVEPVVKLNSYLAGLQRTLELLGLKKK